MALPANVNRYGNETGEYTFTTDHVTEHAPTWLKLLEHFPQKPCRAMEIGVSEGRSGVWLIENKLKAGDEYYAVDQWGDDPTAEQKFDTNTGIALRRNPGIKLTKCKGESYRILPRLLAEGMGASFDYIYIDGCHLAANVLGDLVLAYLLCKKGGLILCDDYLMAYNKPLTQTPKLAIDAFANCFREKVEIIDFITPHQVCFRRTSDILNN